MINIIQLKMLVAATFATTAVAVPDKPNVVFFLVDDLGWSDLGCYGSSFHETPSAARLARDGVRFTDAYAACPFAASQ